MVRAERPKRRWRQTLWTNPEPTWALIMKMKSKVIFFFRLNIQSSLEDPSEKVHGPKVWNQRRTLTRGGPVSSPSNGLNSVFPSPSHTGDEEPFAFYLQCLSTCHLTSVPGAPTERAKNCTERTKIDFFYGRKRHFLLSSLFLWKVDLLVELHVSWDSVHLAWRNVFFHGNEI